MLVVTEEGSVVYAPHALPALWNGSRELREEQASAAGPATRTEQVGGWECGGRGEPGPFPGTEAPKGRLHTLSAHLNGQEAGTATPVGWQGVKSPCSLSVLMLNTELEFFLQRRSPLSLSQHFPVML